MLTVWIFYAFGTRHRHQLRAACASDASDLLDYPSVDMAAVMDANYRDVNSSSDLENWMADLPEQLHSVPLNYLTIPGKTRYIEESNDTVWGEVDWLLVGRK